MSMSLIQISNLDLWTEFYCWENTQLMISMVFLLVRICRQYAASPSFREGIIRGLF
jgi:hypothetical protein